MKRRFAILLLIACLQPSLFAGERPRFTCGVGWGSVTHFYENGYSLYITPDKYLAENFINDWKLNFNAAFELRAGIACRRCELYAYSGYNISTGVNAVLSGSVNNLLDYQYIGKAYNSSTSTVAASADNVYVFYNFGRTYNIRLKLNF